MTTEDKEKFEAFINSFDSSEYDTDNALFDLSNGNFAQCDVDDNLNQYEHGNIVDTSMLNGQWRQAATQAEKYGLNFDVMKNSLNQRVRRTCVNTFNQ
jgi:hypothetical protein